MGFKIDQKQASETPEMLKSKSGLTSGTPLLVTVDEVIGPQSIKATLIIAGLGTQEGTRVVVEQGLAAPNFRSLAQAIEGSDKIAGLRKGDIVCFNNAYNNGGKAAVGSVTARTHDKMRGDVQVMSCMARLSKSSVSTKGATQYVTILNTIKAIEAKSLGDVEIAWASVLQEKWPGGEPGFLIRDHFGGGIDWFLKKGEQFKALLEELEYQGVFTSNKPGVELIPAWNLPAGREQISQDIDVRQETNGARLGPVSKLFVSDEKKGRNGYTPCLAIVSDEEEFAFGGPTGKIIKAVSGLQRCFDRKAIDGLNLTTNNRTMEGKANGIQKLWSEDQVARMKADRISRRGPDSVPQAAKSMGARPQPGQSSHVDYDDDDPTPRKPVIMGRR